MNQVLDKETQQKLEKAKCLEYCAPIERELLSLEGGYNSLIEELTLSEINDSKLAKLNFKSGVREGLRLALGIIQSMRDELTESKNSPSGVKR